MERADEYRRYLNSSEWRRHRDFALARTSGFCQFCGEIAAHVHHVRYPKRFGDEHPHSLVPVCKRCHDAAHGVQEMKPLVNVTKMSELSPFGGQLKYLLSGARVYASAKSWAKALRIPAPLSTWFETGLSRTAMLKKDLAGGELEMSFQNTPVYRWHAVAEILRTFDRQWYKHGFSSRPIDERKELDRFHENYERLISWGYDLQERALASAIHRRTDNTQAITQEALVNALKQAVAPRLQLHDDKLHEHDVVIADIKSAVPMLRDQEEFISVKQAVGEQGLDPTLMPLYPRSNENLSGLTGQMLARRGTERGPSVIARLDGQSLSAEMNTYRRREIYAALHDIIRNKQESLSLQVLRGKG